MSKVKTKKDHYIHFFTIIDKDKKPFILVLKNNKVKSNSTFKDLTHVPNTYDVIQNQHELLKLKDFLKDKEFKSFNDVYDNVVEFIKQNYNPIITRYNCKEAQAMFKTITDDINQDIAKILADKPQEVIDEFFERILLPTQAQGICEKVYSQTQNVKEQKTVLLEFQNFSFEATFDVYECLLSKINDLKPHNEFTKNQPEFINNLYELFKYDDFRYGNLDEYLKGFTNQLNLDLQQKNNNIPFKWEYQFIDNSKTKSKKQDYSILKS